MTKAYKTILRSVALLVLLAAAQRSEASGALDRLLASKAIDREQTAVYVWDLDSDLQVAAHRAAFPITPASVMKCVSTAALKSVMPGTSRITTKVYLQGEKSKDTFRGTLLIVGAGDPSLGDGRHEGQPDFATMIAEALKKKGIASIEGEIKIDDTLFAGPAIHPSWTDSDIDASYGTGCHAFNFEGNASGKKSVADPAAVFRRRLKAALEAAGISFSEGTGDSGRKKELLTQYDSPPLSTLMRSCMFRSDNLYAEAFLRLFGLRNGADGSVGMSSKIAMQHWDALNYPVEALEIADGSGLSRDNRLSAEFLGMVLREKASDPEYVSFFPLAGEEGTVKSFMKDTPLQGRLALKTGSMSGIQSYAGYALDENYVPTHVVVVIANGLKNRSEFRNALGSFLLSVIR